MPLGLLFCDDEEGRRISQSFSKHPHVAHRSSLSKTFCHACVSLSTSSAACFIRVSMSTSSAATGARVLDYARFQVIKACTGEQIDLGHYSTRIDDVVMVEWILDPVAKALDWPVTHVALNVGDVTVKYVTPRAHRTQTFMKSFVEFGKVLTIQAVRLPRPTEFTERNCICDFGGCCRLCLVVQGGSMCSGCGNNGCCRSQNCGHLCCESRQNNRADIHATCPFTGVLNIWY